MKLEQQILDILAEALGYDSSDEFKMEDSLIDELGADSIDFLDILFMIEKEIGIKIDSDRFNLGGFNINDEDYVIDNKLTKLGAEKLQNAFPDREARYEEGASIMNLMRLITIRDFISIVQSKIIADYIMLEEGTEVNPENFIENNGLSAEGAIMLARHIPELKDKFKPGITLSGLIEIYANENNEAIFERMLQTIKEKSADATDAAGEND